MAKRQLRRFQRRGPDRATGLLVEALRTQAAGATLVDVGGGIGAIPRQLAGHGLVRVVHVDGSRPYLDAAGRDLPPGLDRREVHGDFTALADQAGKADLVTLDKVICCYPDMPRLVAAATTHAQQAVGAVFPRNRLFLGAVLPAARWLLRKSGGADIGYLHLPEDIRSRFAAAGFEATIQRTTAMWHVEVFQRASG